MRLMAGVAIESPIFAHVPFFRDEGQKGEHMCILARDLMGNGVRKVGGVLYGDGQILPKT